MTDRKNCPMRHENGNCLTCGGFCTAVNDEICTALRNAYERGQSNGAITQQHVRWEDKYILIFDNTLGRNNLEWKAVCSLCGVPNKQYKPPYCPHCGAKMDGEWNV